MQVRDKREAVNPQANSARRPSDDTAITPLPARVMGRGAGVALEPSPPPRFLANWPSKKPLAYSAGAPMAALAEQRSHAHDAVEESARPFQLREIGRLCGNRICGFTGTVGPRTQRRNANSRFLGRPIMTDYVNREK
jgi:hypothetical protein